LKLGLKDFGKEESKGLLRDVASELYLYSCRFIVAIRLTLRGSASTELLAALRFPPAGAVDPHLFAV